MRKFLCMFICTILFTMTAYATKSDTKSTLSYDAAVAYKGVIDEVVNNYGNFENINNNFASGLIHGEFIDFDNNGTEEMLLIYKEKNNTQNYNWASILIYGMIDDKPVKLLEEEIYGSLGQTDVSYQIGIKDINGQKYVSFNSKKPFLEYGDCESIIIFTMSDEKVIIDKYYAEVLPWWDTFEFVYTKCTVNGNTISEDEYVDALKKFHYDSYRLLLFPGNDFENHHFCTEEKINKFIAIVEAKCAQKDVTVVLDDQKISFDQPPVIVDGRTLVPVRAVVEKMGGTVEWSQDTQTAILKYNDKVIKLTIGSKVALLNGEEHYLDVEPQIINSRTLMPIRFIAENFGFDVEWDNDTNTVVITTII